MRRALFPGEAVKKQRFQQTKDAEESRRVLWESISEKDFMAGIIADAERLGWLTFHTYDSRRSNEGFPDLFMLHPTKMRIVILETKAMKTKTTAKQKAWIKALQAFAIVVGPKFFYAAIVRPSDQALIDSLLSG